MINTGISYFKEILKEIQIIEAAKGEISLQLLLKPIKFKRQNFICDFLRYELDKHELMEELALYAINNNETEILKNMELFYSHVEEGTLLFKIRKEIYSTETFIRSMKKDMANSKGSSFLEKRLVQEINKYVMAQARCYRKMHFFK